MLHLIKSTTDKFFELLSHDPVRPSIPHNERVGANRDIFVGRDSNDKVTAITCVSYQDSIPISENELFRVAHDPDIAIFYTIWSYEPGAGRRLIFDAVNHIRQTNQSISRFVTLSPPTEMARRFHLKNGAVIFRENTETVNYEYNVLLQT